MKKVIIIGAGPAGITAGIELLNKLEDVSVTILEESSEVGGISRTVKHNSNRMDIGGHRFFSKDDNVVKWWENIMPMQGKPSFDDKKLSRNVDLKKGGPDPEKEDKVMLVRNRVSRIYYNKNFFDYPVKMNFTTLHNMGFFQTMVVAFSYLKSVVFKLPEDNLENFYINRFGKKLYSMFFEGYTEKLWGRHPREISADWGAQRVKGLSIIAIIKDVFKKIFIKDSINVETSLIEKFYYPKYGPGQLWETALSNYESLGGKVKLQCKVTKINAENHKIKSVTYLKDNKEVSEEADLLISSMPLKDLVTSMNDVPKDILNIGENLPYRDFVTVGILVNNLAIKNKTKINTLNNIIPDCWIYIQDKGIKCGRIQIFNNWSPYLVKKPEENVWLGLEYFCDENDEYWNMNKEQWVKFATEEIKKVGIIDDNESVIDFHVEKVKKAYLAYFDSYSEIDKLISFLDNYDNLYCIGRNGQHRYNNMDHSMVTAFETVNNIKNNEKCKDNIWNVNTEKNYHEEKNK